MKKNLLFAAMAVAALASCSNDEVIDVNNGGGISFRASLDKAVTRANTANVTNLENLQTFNVTAIGNSANYFTNLDVSSSDRGITWTPASTYYWPNYKLDFFAYAPKITVGTAGIDNEKQKITGFSPAQAVKAQKDLVISYNTGTKTGNEGTGIAMNFKHALSQIEVQAKCSNDKMKVEVIGVKLVNAAAKADFIFPTEVTDAGYSLPQNQWDNLQDKDDATKAYMIKGNSPVTLNSTPKSIMFGDDNWMLIPQKLKKWDGTDAKNGVYLSVLCRIYSVDDGKETQLYPPLPDGLNKYAFAAVGIDGSWNPGMKYTYTLDFCSEGNGAGKIDPTPTIPASYSADSSEIDSNPGIPGDPILNAPIKFTVTVDTWTDQPVDNIDM